MSNVLFNNTSFLHETSHLFYLDFFFMIEVHLIKYLPASSILSNILKEDILLYFRPQLPGMVMA